MRIRLFLPAAPGEVDSQLLGIAVRERAETVEIAVNLRLVFHKDLINLFGGEETRTVRLARPIGRRRIVPAPIAATLKKWGPP